MINEILQGNDPYLVGIDFKDYIEAQNKADNIFREKKDFCKRIVTTLSRLGKLQIDKGIKELCETVWDTPSVEVPKPSLSPKQRVRSWSNLLSMGESKSKSHDDFADEVSPEKDTHSFEEERIDEEDEEEPSNKKSST